MPQEKRDNFFTELLKFALIAAIIVIPVRIFVAQPFIVSGASMFPTFHDGEYLIVDEISYRIGNPERFDIVIFRHPIIPREFLIKRVIGLPGETVRIENGVISVETAEGETLQLQEPYVQNEGNGRALERHLKEGEYFVLGDNRPESSDSRAWGVLPRENIVGRALVRLLPLQQFGIFPGSPEHITAQ